MTVVFNLALVGLSQAATGNFCQNQASYVPTAPAGHTCGFEPENNNELICLDVDGTTAAPSLAVACSAKMATYESALGVTDWTTVVAGGTVCATEVGGHAASVHLDDKARNCCTDGKHVCDVGQGNLCKDQTTFRPTRFAKDGTTCMAKELEYEAAGLFDIASWTTVNAAGECTSKTFGGHALKVHLDDQTTACCVGRAGEVRDPS
jgi:hypothetical protein